MGRGDVSFTFLDRIKEVELNILDQRWQSALALALTLPDICGGIAFPGIVKKYRDGRIMKDRSGEPVRDIGKQYIKWVDIYAADYLKKSPEDREPYIGGERCWQLRCEYLHQNKGFDNEEKEETIHFHLGINCGTSICQLGEESSSESASIRIDIQELCQRLCQAAREYYNKNKDFVNFELYNTPVIDFIRWNQDTMKLQKKVMIVTEGKNYGRGLELVLQDSRYQVEIYYSLEEVGKKLKKRRADVLIMEESFFSQAEKNNLIAAAGKVLMMNDGISEPSMLPSNCRRVSKYLSVKGLRKLLLEIIRGSNVCGEK